MKNQPLTEMQRKNLETAIRLVQLTLENSMQIMAVIAALADALRQQGLAIARRQADAKDGRELVKLNADYRHQATQAMLNSLQTIADLGNDMRIGFAHLLTEQLASGDEELLDAFQSFFAVLPARSPAAAVPAYPAVNKAAVTEFGHIACVSGEKSDELGDLPAARPPGSEKARQPSARAY